MPGRFNEPQRSRILSGVSYMDKLMLDLDEILSASFSNAFPKYKNPLTPVQIRTTRDYIKRLRQQIVHVLKHLQIALPEAKFDSTHAMRVTLQFMEVAIEEIAPERLRGYGEVPEALVSTLAGGLQEMKGIVRQLDSYLIQRPDIDLNARLNRLSGAGDLAQLLTLLVAITDRHGFVEFRDPLSRLIEKIESPAYEIAFFGRVSAGKSSLLNRIIGMDLLPTGVTPVTAVPTRIRNRSEPALLVWTADGRLTRYAIERLADFVTEARNPGNDKRVTRLIAEVPLALLSDEVILVDTPGLGSLALEGAAETLAYLPHCDLGVVLVDASSNLHSDDVATLDALRAASVPSLLTLSKADLVAPEDLERLVAYTRDQLCEQLGIPIDVAPLSSRGGMSHFLEKWATDQITPRIANARELAEESNRRKADSLGQRVLYALEISGKLPTADTILVSGDDIRKAEAELREAASLLESANGRCFGITGKIREAADEAIALVTDNAMAVWESDHYAGHLDASWVAREINQVARNEAEQLAALIQNTARKLSEALDFAAQITSTGERGEKFSLDSLVKELPTPDFSGCSSDLHRPRWLSVSSGLARHSVTRHIESECGAMLIPFFNSYGRALETWFRNILISLEREFSASADVYRAQLQRVTAPGAAAQPGDAILNDVSVLRRKLGFPEVADQTDSRVTG